MSHIRLLLVEDDPVFTQHLESFAQSSGKHWMVTACATAAEAKQQFRHNPLPFDIALVDLGLPDASGVDVIKAIRDVDSAIPILVVSIISAEKSVLDAIRAGARGYILKDDSSIQITDAINEALKGNYPISPALARYLFTQFTQVPSPLVQAASLSGKELALLKHIANGCSYIEAADLMDVSLSTVQTHIRNLYRKLDVHSQTQAVMRAKQEGLI
jgi:two-component system nitrate/nitrite response regulator NarL